MLFIFYLKEGPVEIVKPLEDATGKEGQDLILSVELNKPNQEVEWFKDGVKLSSDSKTRIYGNNNSYFLRINDANPKTSGGVYTFKINDLDTKANVQIEGMTSLNSLIVFIFIKFYLIDSLIKRKTNRNSVSIER